MYRLPAEWENQSFLQLTFPHQNSDWEYMLQEVENCFVQLIKNVAQFQDVLVCCQDLENTRLFFKGFPNVFLFQVPSNDTWARDHGGLSVTNSKNHHILDFTFNGWGNKFEATKDNEITKTLFEKNIFQNAQLLSLDMVLEGGAIESNGKGTLLTTSACLLNKNRNSDMSKAKIEKKLGKLLGIKQFLWLDNGYLAGDDTDSHIDTIARFCNENTIAYVGCKNKNDEHFMAFQEMKNQLQSFNQENGEKYNLVELPMPTACYDKEGQRLPATYANFCIINNAVLVPIYNVKEDQAAIEILSNTFPNRQTIGVDCRPLIEQHGSLHCVTMQYPEYIKLNKAKLIKP